jgi:hypothetical protein
MYRTGTWAGFLARLRTLGDGQVRAGLEESPRPRKLLTDTVIALNVLLAEIAYMGLCPI